MELIVLQWHGAVSSVQPFYRSRRRGNMMERFSRDRLPVFSAGVPCEQFWHGQGSPLFDVVHQAFPLLTIMLPILKDALKDGF